jgi:hypothetical protein
MTENKSTYEKMLEKLQEQGNIKSLSGEEHLELMRELNKGMEEFSIEQKRQQAKAQKELASCVLNA